MKIWDYLKSLTSKEELDFNDDEVRKDYNPYIINRFVSMCDVYLPLANEINKYDIPKEVHYRFYYSTLPKRNQFFKYIKGSKDLSIDEKRIIAKYFEVGIKDADLYIQMLDKEQINEILDIYRYGKNKIANI